MSGGESVLWTYPRVAQSLCSWHGKISHNTYCAAGWYLLPPPGMDTHYRLQAWLKAADVTAAELARRLEYDPSNLNKLLKGTIRPTLDMAFRIERATDGQIPASAWVEAA